MTTPLHQIANLLNGSDVRYAVAGLAWFSANEYYSDIFAKNTKIKRASRGLTILVHPEDFYNALADLRSMPRSSRMAKCIQADVDSWIIPVKDAEIVVDNLSILAIKAVNYLGIFLDHNCNGFFDTIQDAASGAHVLNPHDHLLWLMTEHCGELFRDDDNELIKRLICEVQNDKISYARLKCYAVAHHPAFTVFRANMEPYMHLFDRTGFN